VVKVGCNIHDWMAGVILVLPNEHWAVTGDDGKFVLRDLAPGEHVVVAWHERAETRLDDTARTLAAGRDPADVSFTLVLGSDRALPAQFGTRAPP
jgi:hypothetical protein